MKTVLITVAALLTAALLGVAGSPPVRAARTPASGRVPVPSELTADDVSFTGYGGLALHGSVVAPRKTSGPLPGVVLVTGSGAGVPRDHLLTEAVEFARRGLAVLIYDKRSVGYGDFRRSYSELADDALGGVRALRARPGVDPAKVGLWGLSEGGWVAPLAASRSADVAFVIVVGGNAMPPIRQQLWNETSALRRAGASGSLIDHGKRNFARLGADAGLFAEAFFPAEDVLGRVRQPLLGVWGEHDLQTPPGDNPPLFARALRRGGNVHYTFRFFPGADHGAHTTPDGGVTRGEALAPGYADLVGSWVRDATSGKAPVADAPAPPRQEYRSVEVSPSPWWTSAWAQLAAFMLFVVAFAAYPLVALVRRVRGRTVRPVSRWAPRLLSGAGLAAALGLPFYLFYLMAAGRAPDPGPALAGRPLPWLAVQGLAVADVAAAAGTAVTSLRAAGAVPVGERVRLGLLVTAGAVFIPWAVYWGLLLP
ncbi:alpha/beta hydrolase family protein [Actinomadura syzygii]|uniref:alpha/beta hydrolase family protein n=1 Tax=Actinomadura syzygii TaxID=1427538 RepID=UPI003619391E